MILIEKWAIVRTSQYPADLPTHGMSIEALVKSSLWKKGPSFIQQELCRFSPWKPEHLELPAQEARSFCVVSKEPTPAFIQVMLERCSSYSKLITILAWIQPFLWNMRNSKSRCHSPLSASELRQATFLAIALAQRA